MAPRFLNKNIKRNYLDQGKFVMVNSIKTPEELKEKVPKDYVLKTYTATADEEELLFDKQAESLNIEEKAVILKQRQQEYQKLFSKELPNLVLKSQFIVFGQNKEDARIYEIQPRIDAHIPVNEHLDINQFKDFSQEIKQNLKLEILKFIKCARRVAESSKMLIDFLGKPNLLITDKGELRLIDTNYIPLAENGEAQKIFDKVLVALESVAQKL